MAGSYRDLVAWQRAVDLAAAVHEQTRSFPRDEVFGLTSQMRRAAVSISSNIAEGQGRRSRRDYCRFLYQARGSLLELETQIILAERFGYLGHDMAAALFNATQQTGKLLNGLIRHVEASERQDPPRDT